jgi:predicted aspartyl protease
LDLVEEFEFVPAKGWPAVPRIPVLIHHESLPESISTRATMDTGFDGSLLLSKRLRDAIFKFASPQTHESLDAGGIEIPCEVYGLKVKIAGRWMDITAHAPILGDYENLIGRGLTNRFDICLRGPSGRGHIVESP